MQPFEQDLDSILAQIKPPSPQEFINREFARLGVAGGRFNAKMPEEKAESLLSQVADAGLGTLHYIGTTLDKTFGARAIRGLLGGKPRELLSVLPWSDTLGITSPDDVVTGRDLLSKVGLARQKSEDAGFEWQDVPGIATEILLDPATYLTFGTSAALTGLGKSALKAGVLPRSAAGRITGLAAHTPEAAKLAQATGKTVADVADKPLAGILGIGLPFSDSAYQLGTGPIGRKIGQYLDKVGDAALYSTTGRFLSQMFDPTVRGAKTTEAQKVLREMFPQIEAGKAAGMRDYVKMAETLQAADLLESPVALRSLLERTYQGPVRPEVQQAIDTIRNMLDDMRRSALESGRRVGQLEDEFAAYAPRFQTMLDAAGEQTASVAAPSKSFATSAPSQAHRLDLLRNFQEGTGGVNKLMRDKEVWDMIDQGVPVDQIAEKIRRDYLGITQQDEAWFASLGGQRPPRTVNRQPNPDYQRYLRIRDAMQQSAEMPSFMKNVGKTYLEKNIDYFGNNPLTDLALYAMRTREADAMALAARKALVDNAKPLSAAAGISEPMVSMGEALARTELNSNRGLVNVAQALQDAGVIQTPGNVRINNPIQARMYLRDVMVPRSLVDDIASSSYSLRSISGLNPFINLFDSVTNLTKGWLTQMFPSFHTRNMLTGGWQNLAGGAADPRYSPFNPLAYLQPFKDAAEIRANKPVQGAAEIYKAINPNITDQEATNLLLKEMFEHRARAGLSNETISSTIGLGTHEQMGVPRIPGLGGETPISDVLRGRSITGPTTFNPLDVRGFYGRKESQFLPMRYGEEVGTLGDDLNRMSAYIAFRRQGYEPAMAAAKARQLHYDYSKITPFEREVMRRIFPFYTWMRHNIPYQLGMLASRPGGALGASIRASDAARREGFVPPHVSEGVSIPLGLESPEGFQRYLVNVGLPFEDVISTVGLGSDKPIVRTMEKILGQSNPLIKGPLEMVAGKQFFSGRQLDDLYSRTGAPPFIDQIVMNSPLSRVATLAGQMADPRKDLLAKTLLLMGPAKITDVDMAQERDIVARDVLEARLKQNPLLRRYENIYVPRHLQSQLTPEERELYQLYLYLADKQKKTAQERRRREMENQKK